MDLVALAQILQQLPVHQRLNLEAELGQVTHRPYPLEEVIVVLRHVASTEVTAFQVSAPSHLPAASVTAEQEASRSDLAPPPAGSRKLTAKIPVVTNAPASSNAAASPPADDDDDDEEELDQLLNLKAPVTGNQSDTGEDEEKSVPGEGG